MRHEKPSHHEDRPAYGVYCSKGHHGNVRYCGLCEKSWCITCDNPPHEATKWLVAAPLNNKAGDEVPVYFGGKVVGRAIVGRMTPDGVYCEVVIEEN
jgi:hypothetical protein